jgi:DNA-directed RNA polymerase specialized sigma24 family protein
VPSSLDPPRDPRSVLRAHRPAVPADNPAAERVERLLEVQGTWLRNRVRRTARHFRLDAAELCQELMYGLLRRSTTVDEGNPGVRSWLSVRIERTAIDMVRTSGRTRPAGPEDLEALEREEAARGRWPADPNTEITLDPQRLVRLGLSPNEAQTVALRCTGVDMTLKEFAELVQRSHALVRKEFERGTRKIENLFGLTAEEAEVIRAWRKHGTVQGAAHATHRSHEDVVRNLEDAHKKIDRIFDEKEGLH